MTKGKRYKPKIFEKFYGEPCTLKTLVEIRRCVKCGREPPENSKGIACHFCGGTLITRYVSKSSQEVKNRV